MMFFLLLAVIYRAKGRQAWRETAPWLLGLALVWFIVTPLSIPLFENVRLLQEVDFPFRIVIVADLAVAAVFVLAVRAAWQHRDRLSQGLIGFAAAILVAFLALSGKPFAYNLQPYFKLLKPFQTRQAIDEKAAMVAAGWDSLEFFMPVWTKIPLEDFRSAVTRIPRVATVTPDAGTIEVRRWAPRNIGLHADLRRTTQITVRQFYFPTWRARNAATGGDLRVTPSDPTGLVVIEASAGRYDIVLRLEPLWQEQVGAVLSALGVAVAGGLLIMSRRKWTSRPTTSHS